AFELRPDDRSLAQEVVLWSERSDISEEITRLRAHLQHFRESMGEATGDALVPVGRRLEFVLQEMQREAKTTASKAVDDGGSRLSVAIRDEIERIREQSANVL
ncbi:MAG: DUF1732 domain-containing protein, partial [Polyangiales bacterium]